MPPVFGPVVSEAGADEDGDDAAEVLGAAAAELVDALVGALLGAAVTTTVFDPPEQPVAMTATEIVAIPIDHRPNTPR